MGERAPPGEKERERERQRERERDLLGNNFHDGGVQGDPVTGLAYPRKR